MALPKYKIGEQEFTFLSGPPEKPAQTCEVIDRPGVPGAGVYRMGRLSPRFTLRSETDLASKAAALERYDDYKKLIAQDPVNVVWADQDANTTRQFGVIVVAVRLAGVPASYAICVGGLNVQAGQAGVWLACDWDLISLETT